MARKPVSKEAERKRLKRSQETKAKREARLLKNRIYKSKIRIQNNTVRQRKHVQNERKRIANYRAKQNKNKPQKKTTPKSASKRKSSLNPVCVIKKTKKSGKVCKFTFII